jgi:hypothetical protein
MHLGELRITRREPLEVLQGPLVFTDFRERQRRALQRRPVIRRPRETALVQRGGIGMTLGQLANVRSKLELIRRGIRALYRTQQIVSGTLMLALLGSDIAKPFECLCVLWIEREDLVQEIRRFSELSGSEFLLRRGERAGYIATHGGCSMRRVLNWP